MCYAENIVMNQRLPPDVLIPWLQCESSLTEKLITTAGEARLQLLNEFWQLPDDWACQRLSIEPATQVWYREILMVASHHRCWYARSIYPKATHDAGLSLFFRLKNEPLGHLIFNNPDIQRIELSYYPIDIRMPEYQYLTPDLTQQNPVLWSRLSTFLLYQQFRFYLLEIMLPGLSECLMKN